MYLREIEGWFASYKNITPQRASRPTTLKSYKGRTNILICELRIQLDNTYYDFKLFLQ